jgi:hypothetical protein
MTSSGTSKYFRSPSNTINMSKANSLTIFGLMMRVGSVGLPLDKATKYFRIKISIQGCTFKVLLCSTFTAEEHILDN